MMMDAPSFDYDAKDDNEKIILNENNAESIASHINNLM
jgi:hypothetical protein